MLAIRSQAPFFGRQHSAALETASPHPPITSTQSRSAGSAAASQSPRGVMPSGSGAQRPVARSRASARGGTV